MSARGRAGRPRGYSINKEVLSSGETRYRAVVDIGVDAAGKRRQRKKRFSTRQEASEWIARTRTEVVDGRYQHAADVTVGQWLDRWLEGRELLHENTRAGYRSDLKPVYAKFGETPLQGLTSSMVTALKAEMRTTGGRRGTGRAPRTINLMLTLLAAALEVAVAEQLIKVNPASNKLVERPKTVPFQGSSWFVDEVAEFLRKLEGERYAAAWHLSVCGLRRSEVLGLRWCDIDFESCAVSIVQARTPKKGKGVTPGSTVIDKPKRARSMRKIPVPAPTIAALKTFRVLQGEERLRLGQHVQPTDLIVVNEVGEPIHPDTYSTWFRRVIKHYGIRDIRLHDVRRTAATLLATHYEVQSDAAAAYLGHSERTYHDVYVVGETGFGRVNDALSDMQQGEPKRRTS